MKEKPAIILPLDGSEIATVALGAAQAMTNIMGGVLHIVHVTEERLSEEELLKKLKVGRIEVRNFSIHQIDGGNIIDGIIRFAASVETGMIVMSSHGWTYSPEYLLGNVTMGVVQRAIDPVMVIRPGIKNLPDASWRPTKMLLPQNGTPTAAAVIDQVFRLARLMEADIDVLNIGVVGKKPPAEAGTMIPPRYLDYPQYDWPAWASEFIERFYAHRPPGIKLSLFEREGDPADVMIKFALENGDDLITLGWHGHFEPGRAAVVKDLLRKTELPVVLIWSRE